MVTLPSTIPLFPLPNVVLFPSVFLPLHVFEPRYRQMTSDALATDRLIGITLLRPGWRDDYEGRPAVYPIGCAGLISHADPLPDGRFNIVLRGLSRFRILSEDHSRVYRVAAVEWLQDEVGGEPDALRFERHRLEALLEPMIEGGRGQIPTELPDDQLVNALAQYLDLDPVERLALLEHDRLIDRARALIDLIEIRRLSIRVPSGSPGAVH